MTIANKLWYLVLTGVALALLAGPATAQIQIQVPYGGQQGGPIKVQYQGGDKKGGKKNWWDQTPEERFAGHAKGKDHIVIAEVEGFAKGFMEKYAKDNGITNGILTRDQYMKMSEEGKKWREKIKPPAPDGNKAQDKKDEKKPESAADFETRIKKEAEAKFKELDKNDDKVLNQYEMNHHLKMHYKRFDKDKNGLINLAEYTEYYRARAKGELNGPPPGMDQKKGDAKKPSSEPETGIVIDLTILDQRPVVYTATNLPKGLPAWFAELDTDKDGQIGLYEWLAAKKPMNEFKTMDRNQDGFLTPEEVLQFLYPNGDNPAEAVAQAQASPGSASMEANRPGNFPNMGGNMKWGGWNNGGGKKGDWKNGKGKWGGFPQGN